MRGAVVHGSGLVQGQAGACLLVHPPFPCAADSAYTSPHTPPPWPCPQGFCWKGHNPAISRLLVLWVGHAPDASHTLLELASDVFKQVPGGKVRAALGLYSHTPAAARLGSHNCSA